MALGLSLRAGSDARGRRRAPQLVALAFGLFGLAVAALAFGVLAGANVLWTEIASAELVGLSYIIAGTIAWLRGLRAARILPFRGPVRRVAGSPPCTASRFRRGERSTRIERGREASTVGRPECPHAIEFLPIL